MVNYQLGKIYKIVCNVTDLVYIGSTCEPTLARRLTKHVNNYKRYLDKKYHYTSSYDILESGDYDMILIESYPCNSKDELHARERYWTNQIKCVNKYKNQGLVLELGKAGYDKHYYQEHKDHIKLKCMEYRNLNKELIKTKKSLKKAATKLQNNT